MVVVVGITLGSIASLATLLPFAIARIDSLMPAGSPWIYISVVVVAAFVTLTATLWSAWHTLRTRPITASGR